MVNPSLATGESAPARPGDGGGVYAVVVGVLVAAMVALFTLVGMPAAEAAPAVPTIPVGTTPVGAAVSPDGATAYVTNSGSGTVSVIDTASNTARATVTVGSGPYEVAVSPDGATVYVTNYQSGTVSVIDTASNTVTATITGVAYPRGVTVSPDGATVYVAKYGSAAVSVIDTASDTVTATIPVGLGPVRVAVSPDGATAYVTNYGSSTVSVIDTSSNTAPDTITGVASPYGMAVTPDGATAYVTNYRSGTVSVISPLPAAPRITSGPPPAATAGASYAFTLRATGYPAPTFAVTAGALPAGLVLDSASGLVSGAPTEAGPFDVTITATNTVGATTGVYTMTVHAAEQTITFDTEPPAGAVIGGSYTPTATATSGLPVTISLATSSAGVCTLDNGVVTFTGVGSCVLDANQPGNSIWQPAPQVQQTIRVAGVTPQISVSGSGSFTVSKPGSVTLTGTGTPTPTLSESGTLPAGLSFSAGTDGQASISGTPKPGTAGRYKVTVTAGSAAGHARLNLTITVVRVPTSLATHGPSSASAGAAVTLSATVTGGDPPTGTVTFSTGSTMLGVARVDGDGHAKVTSADLPTGAVTVTASYSGDRTYAPSSAEPILVTITAAPPPTPLTPRLPNTGTPAGQTAALAGLLLAAGAALLAASRRHDIHRRNQQT